MNLLNRTLAVALIAGGASSLSGSADAVPLGASLSLRDASTPALQPVQWRRWGWGGFGVGLATGAIIGGAIAATTYPAYGYGYGYPAYGYGYGYPAYGYGYGYAPRYYYAPAYYGGYAPAYVYPRYRTGLYVRRAWRRW